MQLIYRSCGIIKQTMLLARSSLYQYHIADMLKRGKVDNKIKIYSPAIHLYVDKVLKSEEFSEVESMIVMIELQKIPIEKQTLHKFFAHIVKNVDKIQTAQSISNILSSMQQLGIKEKELVKRVGDRGFQILKIYQQTGYTQAYSLFIIRIIIALHSLTGIKDYTQQQFSTIPLNQFKPLFLTYLLQILWKEGLQQYKIATQILDISLKNKNFIPFSDVHHMRKLIRLIQSPKYFQLMEYLDHKLKSNINSQTINQQMTAPDQSKQIGRKQQKAKQNRFDQSPKDTNIVLNTKKNDPYNSIKQGQINPQVIKQMHNNFLDDLYQKYF